MLIFIPINLLIAIFCLLSSVGTIGSILVSISLSQMSRFLIGMDTFTATKCQIGTKSDVNDDQIKQCISGMNVANLGTIFNLSLEKGHPERKLLSHQSSIAGPSTSTRQLASSELTPMSSAQLIPSYSFDSPISEQLTPMRSLGSSISAKLTPMHSFDALMSAQLAPSHSFDTAADLIGHNHSFDQMDSKKAGKSLINDKKQKHIELEADQFVAFMLKKMLKKVPVEFKERLKIFQKQKRNRTLAEELSNLTSKQNLLMLLELYYMANSMGEIFLKQIAANDQTDLRKFGGKNSLIDFEYYEETNQKFSKIYQTILINEPTKKIANKMFPFRRTKSGKAFFWFNSHKTFLVANEWRDGAENILEWKFKVKIASTKLGKIIRTIGQFIRIKCGKYLWNLVEETDEIQNCAKQINFSELNQIFLKKFAKNNENTLGLLNLVGNLLNVEALTNSDTNEKVSSPYSEDIFTEIESYEQKIHILNGLLNFGRLFMNSFLALAMKITEENRTINWKNISIIFTRNKNAEEENYLLKKLMIEAGLMEEAKEKVRT